MIRYLTGGDVCFGQPVNVMGGVLCVLFGIIAWELFKYTLRNLRS